MKRLMGLVLVLAVAGCVQGNVLSLAEGDCFDDPDGTESADLEVTDVPIVDCADPHDNEVYHIVEVTGDDYPGTEAIGAQADTECVDRFESFVGAPYDTSDLNFGWLTPTAESWSGGDREILCFVYRVDLGKMTGTMENAGI